jgi:hypothetical protein
MAALTATIECPECGDEIEVPVRMTAEGPGEGRLVLTVQPDPAPVAEHYAEHYAISST